MVKAMLAVVVGLGLFAAAVLWWRLSEPSRSFRRSMDAKRRRSRRRDGTD